MNFSEANDPEPSVRPDPSSSLQKKQDPYAPFFEKHSPSPLVRVRKPAWWKVERKAGQGIRNSPSSALSCSTHSTPLPHGFRTHT